MVFQGKTVQNYIEIDPEGTELLQLLEQSQNFNLCQHRMLVGLVKNYFKLKVEQGSLDSICLTKVLELYTKSILPGLLKLSRQVIFFEGYVQSDNDERLHNQYQNAFVKQGDKL